MHRKKEKLLEALMTLLIEKDPGTSEICGALGLICSALHFTQAAVYERALQYDFALIERRGANISSLPAGFSEGDTLYEAISSLEDGRIFYLHEDVQASPAAALILQHFSAHALTLMPLYSDENSLLALLVFVQQDVGAALAGDDPGLLHSSVALLGHALQLRSHRNMIRRTRRSMGALMDHSGIDIYINDFETHEVLYINHSMAAPYGGKEAFENRRCWEVLYPDQSGPCEFCPQKKIIDEQGRPTKVYTWDYQRPFDGSWFRVFSSAFRWPDGRLAHMVCSADITENKRNEALIAYMANYDALTDLPNRRKLIQDCDAHISKALHGEKCYVLFLDIDGFKSVNDTLGHAAGDELLVQISKFFSEISLLQGVIYRNGGDEFVAFLVGDHASRTCIEALVAQIHQRFAHPWQLKAGRVNCNTSIGIACYPEDGTNAESLVTLADKAMYAAKKQGGGTLRFARDL